MTAYCTTCGERITSSSRTVAEQRLGEPARLVKPSVPLNQPCGHRAPIRWTNETPTYPAEQFDGEDDA